MKKIFLILIAVLVVGAALFAAWYFMQEEQEPTASEPVVFPIANPDSGSPATRATILIAGQDRQIEVNDFLTRTDTYEDAINPGYYYLGSLPPQAGKPDTLPFHILFIAESAYFNVVINSEPIGENRKAAESYLMSVLGINQDTMCDLIYTVTVPNSVNTAYSGTSLGFSFCPGAVRLP